MLRTKSPDFESSMVIKMKTDCEYPEERDGNRIQLECMKEWVQKSDLNRKVWKEEMKLDHPNMKL